MGGFSIWPFWFAFHTSKNGPVYTQERERERERREDSETFQHTQSSSKEKKGCTVRVKVRKTHTGIVIVHKVSH